MIPKKKEKKVTTSLIINIMHNYVSHHYVIHLSIRDFIKNRCDLIGIVDILNDWMSAQFGICNED